MKPGTDTLEQPQAPPKRRWPNLSVQILIGMVLGILAGLFFGELIAPVQVVGEIFIALLQMTVLPYILISLIAGLGKLSYGEVRLLAVRGGRFVLLFWLIALVVAVAFTASFPGWESATFFSSSLVEIREPTDLVALYIPANPFFALSSSVVPAVVLFSLAIGLAVIGVPGKGGFLADLDVLGEAIMRIAGFVAQLAPIGVFALIAAAAGTLDVEALGRLQVYILTYIGAALLLSFWILPGLVGVLTPLKSRRVLSACQDALVTAFATGSLLIVLPLIADRLKALLVETEIRSQDAESAVDLVVPINFNLPNLGKLLSLAFVPFAGWFAGTTLSIEQYPLFLFSGLLSFFGEVVVALPFLLDLMRIPTDMFQLFLAVDVFTGRFGTLLAGVHTIVLALLTAAAVSGHTRLRWGRPSGAMQRCPSCWRWRCLWGCGFSSRWSFPRSTGSTRSWCRWIFWWTASRAGTQSWKPQRLSPAAATARAWGPSANEGLCASAISRTACPSCIGTRRVSRSDWRPTWLTCSPPS